MPTWDYKSIRAIIHFPCIIIFHVLALITFCVHHKPSSEMTNLSPWLFWTWHQRIFISHRVVLIKFTFKLMICMQMQTDISLKIANPYFLINCYLSFTMKMLIKNYVRNFIEYYMEGLLHVELLHVSFKSANIDQYCFSNNYFHVNQTTTLSVTISSSPQLIPSYPHCPSSPLSPSATPQTHHT